MKKQALAVFALATLLITPSVGSSYSPFGFGVRADIPFDFVVGNKTLPSGTYTVKLLEISQTHLVFQGQVNNELAFVRSITVSAEDTLDNSPKLIFNRYGDQYFLSQAWSGARLDGREIPKSKREREQLAQGMPAPEVVSIIALNR